MKTRLELLDERQNALREAEGVAQRAGKEGRVLTDDDNTEIARQLDRAQKIEKDITALDADLKSRAAIKAEIEKQTAPAVDVPPPSPDRLDDLDRYSSGTRLVAFRGPNARDRAFASGQWLRGFLFDHPGAREWCYNNGIASRAQGTTVNTAGGFLVPDQFSSAIIDLRDDYGVFRREATVWPMASDTGMIPMAVTGPTASFVAENAETTATDATWSQVQLTARKLTSLCKISNEIAEDAVINLAEWVARHFAWAFAQKEDQCGFIGNGTSTYGGIYGILRKIEANSSLIGYYTVATIDTGLEVTINHLAALMGLCPSYALANAKWYCSPTVKASVFDRLFWNVGGATMTEVAGMRMPTFGGYPIVTTPVMNACTSATDELHLLAFGDLRLAAVLGSRRDITVKMATELYAATDQIGIFGTERFDIACHGIGDTSTAGPFVAMIGETS